MSTAVSAPDRPVRAAADAAQDSRLDSRWVEQDLGGIAQSGLRPERDRSTRGLVLGLLAAALVLSWMRMLAGGPHLPVDWLGDLTGLRVLTAAPSELLKPLRGQQVQALLMPDGQPIEAAAIGRLGPARWIVDDRERAAQVDIQQRLATALQQPQVLLRFAEAGDVPAPVAHRGLAGLGIGAWLLAGLALALLLAAGMVLLSNPGVPAALFGLLAAAQSVNLLLIGAELMPGLGMPGWLGRQGLSLRWAADTVLAAALVNLMALYPRRLRYPALAAALIWGGATALLAGLVLDALPGAWWWAQGWMLACGLVAAVLLHLSHRADDGPLARLLQRLVLAAVLTLGLLNMAQAMADQSGPGPHEMALAGSVVWQVFVASLMLLGPFLSRTRQGLRQLALLAGISSVAASLDLLLETGLELGTGTALLVAVAVSAGLYRLARRWIKGQLAASAGMSAERLFDSLYRVARALEPKPEQAGQQISALLREVFDPLELSRNPHRVSRVRVTRDGSTLVVPIPTLADDNPQASKAGSIVLRHARQGQRLFSPDDQQLAERVIEQLGRAVAYDRAVERGRTEERTRIAQDLHDDIGARLLTLMYRAPNAEIEEYIRHTLQDLKTLTRGLAASNHRLSHAAAEWKADLSQRLTAVGCDLRWSFSADRDVTLNVVQWSGLTRVLRELVNNIISHAKATLVEVSVQVDRGQLALTVVDDGIGRAPETWSHGLGLGGVRKRVKLLGGQVRWQEGVPRGIRCEVRAPLAPDKPT